MSGIAMTARVEVSSEKSITILTKVSVFVVTDIET